VLLFKVLKETKNKQTSSLLVGVFAAKLKLLSKGFSSSLRKSEVGRLGVCNVGKVGVGIPFFLKKKNCLIIIIKSERFL